MNHVVKKGSAAGIMRNKKNDNITAFKTLALVTQLGLTMIAAIGISTAAGLWLDKHLGTSWITVVLFAMGAVAGGQSAYRIIRKIYEPEQKEKERDLSGEDHPSVKKD